MRGQKDYELALKDIEEAEKLEPTDKDALRFKKLTLEDIELEREINFAINNITERKIYNVLASQIDLGTDNNPNL